MRAILFVAGLATLAFGAKTPTPIDAVRPYRSWSLVTPKPVDMSPQMLALCRSPLPWESDANPHIPSAFRVFVNDKGRSAMQSLMKPVQPRRKGSAKFPVGTMIVKEKFARVALPRGSASIAGDPTLFTVMVKREIGYGRQNGDWEYFVLDGGMKRAERTEIRPCQSCHQQRKSSDFVFGSY